jgi:hypothetical protein
VARRPFESLAACQASERTPLSPTLATKVRVRASQG